MTSRELERRHGFNVHGRREWRARSPRPRTRQDPHSVSEAFVHWPAAPGHLRESNPEIYQRAVELHERAGRITTAAQEAAWMRAIQVFHMDVRGWSDFAYSYAVFKSGRIWAGRTIQYVPAGQEGHNTGTVAIVCALGMDDEIPREMTRTLLKVVPWLEDYAGHELRVRAHRDVNETTCPGPRLAALVPKLDRQ